MQIDAVAGPRADERRFGRVGGWKARFHRSGTAATRGPLVVESRADVFGGSGGARDDLDAYRTQFEQTRAARVVPVGKVGDAAVASTQLQSGALRVRFYTIAWRDRNVTASVTVNGFDGKLDAGRRARAGAASGAADQRLMTPADRPAAAACRARPCRP